MLLCFFPKKLPYSVSTGRGGRGRFCCPHSPKTSIFKDDADLRASTYLSRWLSVSQWDTIHAMSFVLKLKSRFKRSFWKIWVLTFNLILDLIKIVSSTKTPPFKIWNYSQIMTCMLDCLSIRNFETFYFLATFWQIHYFMNPTSVETFKIERQNRIIN